MTGTFPEENPDTLAEETFDVEGEEELDEPEEGNLITYDFVKVWEVGNTKGKPVLCVREDEDFNARVKAFMDSEEYWPNVWFISDHGNTHLLSLMD